MYRYIFSATGARGVCPTCGEKADLLHMTEEKETAHPILNFKAWTSIGCSAFPRACRSCLVKQQRPGAITV